jgi:hypothetical protein
MTTEAPLDHDHATTADHHADSHAMAAAFEHDISPTAHAMTEAAVSADPNIDVGAAASLAAHAIPATALATAHAFAAAALTTTHAGTSRARAACRGGRAATTAARGIRSPATAACPGRGTAATSAASRFGGTACACACATCACACACATTAGPCTATACATSAAASSTTTTGLCDLQRFRCTGVIRRGVARRECISGNRAEQQPAHCRKRNRNLPHCFLACFPDVYFTGVRRGFERA